VSETVGRVTVRNRFGPPAEARPQAPFEWFTGPNDNRFFVVMTGDSRDKDGAYHCSEAETELFFKERGLSVYNKIVYLESEFTRLAHAKKTLNYRKFPKREQKIIVAFKGDISCIPEHFSKIGRL
jgi:hypothetical protein